VRRFQAQQDAVRAAAAASSVPNGLAPGGLVIAPGAGSTPDLWTGAALPTQSTTGERTGVEITQTRPKVILTWETFNVGRQTDVHFDQTAGGADAADWIALNRVTDPNARPSQILGSIRAEGQVYLINPNGIVFGGSSQVNVNSVCSSRRRVTSADGPAWRGEVVRRRA
jgi:filamentous hemagglutinin family protein